MRFKEVSYWATVTGDVAYLATETWLAEKLWGAKEEKEEEEEEEEKE